MNKYIWAEYRSEFGYPTIKQVVCRNYTDAIEKVSELYENELDEEIQFDGSWEDLCDSLDGFDIILGDKLLDIEEL